MRSAAVALMQWRAITAPVNAAFHFLWYYSKKTWKTHTFLGYPLMQNPLDLHVYQEIVFATRPAFIIQTGVAAGGSILYFATLLDAINAPAEAIVIGIDIALSERAKTLNHRRIRLVEGDSVAEDTLDRVRSLLAAPAGMVVLDSDHHRAHVLRELELYHPLVSPGSYLVVEDTNLNGHPVAPFNPPGPYQAVKQFLGQHPEFERSAVWHKNLVSHHAHGWLRRRA
jgi:cephalosporin hydroxylase